MITDDDCYKAMEEYEKFLCEENEKIDKNNSCILKEVENNLTPYKFKKLISYLEEVDSFILKGLVCENEVFGTKDNVDYWFKYIFIRQSSGYIGDDYKGYLFIPVFKDKFLKVYYEC